MITALLQLPSVTKSFGAVRALKGVSFELRASAPGQPGGLPDFSRGLSAATPPEHHPKTTRTPEGCQNRSLVTSCNHRSESLAPLRGALQFCPLTGGIASLRSAQPPANFYETSGLEIASQSRFRLGSEIESAFRCPLQLTSVTKSFGSPRALNSVLFDLRAGAPGQPEGLPDISRGLSAATPPEHRPKTTRTPEGCQNRSSVTSRNHRSESLAPLRGASYSVLYPWVSPRVARLNPRLISARPPVSSCRATPGPPTASDLWVPRF